jgi:two-component sensor histidine kinase
MFAYRISFLCFIMLLTGLKSYCQNETDGPLKKYHILLEKSSQDTNRISALIKLGNYYLFLPLERKPDLDSASNYLRQAIKLSDDLHSEEWHYKGITALGVYYFESKNSSTGEKLIKKAINYFQKIGNRPLEANAWELLAGYLLNDKTENHEAEGLVCYDRAIDLYKKAGNRFKTVELNSGKAIYYTNNGRYDDAEKIFLQMHDSFKKLNYFGDSDGVVLDWLAYLAFVKSDFNKELHYALENLAILKNHPKEFTKQREALLYIKLSMLYRDVSNLEKSKYYAEKQLSIALRLKMDYTYALNNLTYIYIKQRRPAQGLKILQKTINTAPLDSLQKMPVYTFFGDIYKAMGQNKLAERYYKLAIQFYQITDPENKNSANLAYVYQCISDFYVSTHDFKKAELFLNIIRKKAPDIPPLQKSKIALIQSRIDSAAGRYLPALKSFQDHKRLADSIFNVQKSHQMNELEVSFESKQKQNEIDLLAAQNKTNLALAQKANLQRNITTAGILVMFIISGIIYYSFRVKIKSNRILTLKKGEIDKQYERLQILLDEKEELLTEKEGLLIDKDMLLKEVHHRVKNNLQIVTSLLSTQLAYLDNNDAIQALEESQQRVQAIALIHQKLYRETGGVSIEMQSYVFDLVEDLKSVLGATKRAIKFITMIDDIYLDIDLAIPVGLILNEAITNSIKYAFDDTGGEVHISMLKTEDQHCALAISDNGRGLPENFDFDKVNSLGMIMMKGLGGQLQADFKIDTDHGLKISLKFPLQKRIIVRL